MSKTGPGMRCVGALRAVLPRSVTITPRVRGAMADVTVNGQSLRLRWAGEGWLHQIGPLISGTDGRPDIVAARRMSPGARAALSDAGIGWVDETGAAEIVIGSIIVARSGHPDKQLPRKPRWTRAVLAISEALLCGTEPTVAATRDATGLSTGSCSEALRALTKWGLLAAEAERGRASGRHIPDQGKLLEGYASAAAEIESRASLEVGVTWRDVIDGLVETGRKWNQAGTDWAATGAAASLLVAPFLSSVQTAEVYVDARSVAELQAVAEQAGLRPINGGRLTLKTFPTVTVSRLATTIDKVRVAPWPRIYADLRTEGVRGEEAAEHLWEVKGGS